MRVLVAVGTHAASSGVNTFHILQALSETAQPPVGPWTALTFRVSQEVPNLYQRVLLFQFVEFADRPVHFPYHARVLCELPYLGIGADVSDLGQHFWPHSAYNCAGAALRPPGEVGLCAALPERYRGYVWLYSTKICNHKPLSYLTLALLAPRQNWYQLTLPSIRALSSCWSQVAVGTLAVSRNTLGWPPGLHLSSDRKQVPHAFP